MKLTNNFSATIATEAFDTDVETLWPDRTEEQIIITNSDDGINDESDDYDENEVDLAPGGEDDEDEEDEDTNEETDPGEEADGTPVLDEEDLEENDLDEDEVEDIEWEKP